MRIDQLFPSKFLKASDLGGKQVTVTIAKLVIEELGHGSEKESKPCLYFEKASKSLVLNRTNAMTIARMYGNESNDWPGKRVTLHAIKIRAFGVMQDTVRVLDKIPPAPAPVPAAAAVEDSPDIDDQEDIIDHDESAPPRDIDPATGEILDGHDSDPGDDTDQDFDALWGSGPLERATPADLDKLAGLGMALYGVDAWPAQSERMVEAATTGTTKAARELRPKECEQLIRVLSNRLAAKVQATADAVKPAADAIKTTTSRSARAQQPVSNGKVTA